MACIKFLFLVFGLLIVQANCSSIGSDDPDDGDENIIISISVIWKVVIVIVDFITDYGISTIRSLNDESTAIEDKLHDLEEYLIDLLWNFIVSKLDEAEADATDFIKAAIQCVKEDSDGLKVIYLNFTSQISICEVQRQVQTLNTFVPLLTHTRNTNEDLKKYMQQIEECGKDKESIPCINEISGKVNEALGEWLNVAVDDISDASKFIDNIGRFVSLCEQDAVAKLETVIKGVSSEISECIQNKITQ